VRVWRIISGLTGLMPPQNTTVSSLELAAHNTTAAEHRSQPQLNQLGGNDFELFQLSAVFSQDGCVIDERWRALQAQVHPDRFVREGAAAQRVAMQWSTRVNEAYQRLKNPLRRAVYLCQLRGAPVQAESNTAMPVAFLMQQIEWRETLEQAKTTSQVVALAQEVCSHQAKALLQIECLLDEKQDALGAVQLVRELMFLERFLKDIQAHPVF
jgi:molecular chaperone HscB